MFYLNFLWRTRLSIWSNERPWWGPWGPLQAIKQSKHASNHHIFLCLPSMGLTPSFPIHESSHSTSLSRLPTEHEVIHLGPWGGPLGAPSSQKMSKICPKSPDILLSAFLGNNDQTKPQIIIYAIQAWPSGWAGSASYLARWASGLTGRAPCLAGWALGLASWASGLR